MMKSKKYILLIAFSGLFNFAFGQSDSITSVNYAELHYQIVTLDSNIVKDWNSKTHQMEPLDWDSTYSFANIIFPNLPTHFDKDSLDKRVRSILIDKKIRTSYVWRDTNSLWMVKFSYRSDEMREEHAKSWLMYARLEESELR